MPIVPIVDYAIVHLKEEEARLFALFQKHYALIGLLESIKAFDIKNGSVQIHFNNLGEIKAIDKFESFKT